MCLMLCMICGKTLSHGSLKVTVALLYWRIQSLTNL
jgi:hypothetical protein